MQESSAYHTPYTITPVKSDPDKRTATVRFDPDPDFYEKIEKDGETLLLDKRNGLTIPFDRWAEFLCRSLQGKPIYWHRNPLENFDEYLQHRFGFLAATIYGKVEIENNNLFSYRQSSLKALKPGLHRCAVLAVDIVQSTEYSIAVGAKQSAKVFKLVQLEVANWAARFYGIPIKYTGDGCTAIFPIKKDGIHMYPPNMSDVGNNVCSNAIHAAMITRYTVDTILNSCLHHHDLPHITLRFGLDFGDIEVCKIEKTSSPAGFECYGATINLAHKVQSIASDSQIWLTLDALAELPQNIRNACEDMPVDHPLIPGHNIPLYQLNMYIDIDPNTVMTPDERIKRRYL